MRFYLEKSAEHLEKGLAHHGKREYAKARFQYLKAAEYLYKAARESAPSLKKERIAQAEKLWAMTTDLPSLPAAAPAPAAKARAQQPAGDANASPARWRVYERPGVTFADVAGLETVKEQVRLKLIYPFTHPEKAKRFGVKAGGGILLFGPPGTGKTLIARAIAGEIEAAFFTVKPSEIMSKWVGESEQNVSALFGAAKSHPRSIVFIDEVEALVPKRYDSGSTVMQRVVPQFLAELEGFETRRNSLLFIGATNQPWALDPAVLRPGRFDEKIYVPLPDAPARKKILFLNLRDKPLAEDFDFDALARKLDGYSGADIANLCRKAGATPFLECIKAGVERPVGMGDVLTAMHDAPPSVTPKALEKYQKFMAA